MKKKKTGALKRKMLFGMLLILIPVLGVVTLLFWQTRSALKEEYIRTAHHDLREVSRNVDEKVDEVYAMSDVYAGTDEFEDYAETIYSKRSSSYKKGAIVRIHVSAQARLGTETGKSRESGRQNLKQASGAPIWQYRA